MAGTFEFNWTQVCSQSKYARMSVKSNQAGNMVNISSAHVSMYDQRIVNKAIYLPSTNKD